MGIPFTPQDLGGDVTLFQVAVRTCPVCTRNMVCGPKRSGLSQNTFPTWVDNDFYAQAKRASFVLQSDIQVDDEYICRECEAANLVDFLCNLCEERKPTSKKSEAFGCAPTEYLCSDCYGSVSAKRWDEAISRLEDAHKYDFE